MATATLPDAWNSSVLTENPGDAEEVLVVTLPLYKLSRYLWLIGAPTIVLLGNFGNIMTILIMQRTKSGESVVNLYFTALAIIDMVTLNIFLIHEWIAKSFAYWVIDESNVICKIHTWITTGSTTLSGWFLVSLTVHRALSVVWPHRINSLCTRRIVIGLLSGITAFFALVYSHYLYGYSLVYLNKYNVYQCLMRGGNYLKFMEDVFTFVDMVFYSLLPFVCLIFANTLLVWKLRLTVREARHKFAEGRYEQVTNRMKTANSVTLTVILVSLAFIVLTLPSSVNHIVHLYFVVGVSSGLSVYQRAEVYLIGAVTYLLMFWNSAVNFYLYCLTGKRFREEFIKVICCGRIIRSLGLSSEGSSKQSVHHVHDRVPS